MPPTSCMRPTTATAWTASGNRTAANLFALNKTDPWRLFHGSVFVLFPSVLPRNGDFRKSAAGLNKKASAVHTGNNSFQ